MLGVENCYHKTKFHVVLSLLQLIYSNHGNSPALIGQFIDCSAGRDSKYSGTNPVTVILKIQLKLN